MSDSCVELVTFDQLLRRYPQLEQHRIAPTGGAFCRAEPPGPMPCPGLWHPPETSIFSAFT